MVSIISVQFTQHLDHFILFLPGNRILIDIPEHQRPKLHHRLKNIRRHGDAVFPHTVLYNIMYESIQPFSRGIAQKSSHCDRNIIFCDDPCPLGIVHIMVDIGDLVRKTYHLSFQCERISAGAVIHDPIADFPGKVQPVSVLLQYFHNPDALLIVCKTTRMYLIQCSLSCMSKRRMSQIMPQSDRFHQIFI